MAPSTNRSGPQTRGGAQETPEELAAAFVRRRLEGVEEDPEGFAERLLDPADRRCFLELVETAERIDVLLPRQAREGVVISGRYRILRELGQGGMGKVFAARDEVLGREVALKVLHAASFAAVDAVARFERESRLQATLDHPNVAPIHEAGRDGDLRYFVMDLVEGASLREVFDRLRARDPSAPPRAPRQASELRAALGAELPPGRRDLIDGGSYFEAVARILADLARTVEAAHARGIVHRDLKPGNVMLRGDGSPVVLDFGLAGLCEGRPGDVTLQLLGSAAYLAPEQAVSGKVGRDPRSDVYQLGLVLYEALTLRRAFPGNDATKILDDIARGRFERPRRLDRRIPLALEAICLRAMELDPARRYPSAGALALDLERFLEGDRPPLAMGGGRMRLALRDLRYAVRRHRRPLQLAAALVLGGCAAWLAVTRGTAPDPTDDWRPFVVRGWQEAAPAARFDAASIAPGEVLGVRAEFGEPRWLYAYALYGPLGDPDAYVCPLVPEVLEGRVLERSAHGARVAPGEVFCALSEAEPGIAYEGVVFVAASERRPVLEWWLSRLPIDGDVPIEEARGLLSSVREDDLFVATRGGPVGREVARDEVRRAILRLRSEERGDERYPFEGVRWNRLFRLPVR